ncbi:DNA translocase FtsK, partial [Ureaplasma parvum]
IIGYANLDLYRANAWIFTIVIMFMVLVLISFILITFGTKSHLGLKFKKCLVNKIITNINNYHKKDYQLSEQNFFEEKLGEDHHNIDKQLEQKEVIQEQNLQIKNFNDRQTNSSCITKNDKLKTTILEPIVNDINQFRENPSTIKNNKYNFYPRIDIIDGKSQDYLH